MPFVEKPTVLAIMMADALYLDTGSGKYTILGCFTDLATSTFPFVAPTFSVFLVLTDSRGDGDIVVRIVDVDDEHEIDRKTVSIDLRDPRMVLQFPVQFDGTEFPAAGEYRIQALAGDEILIERRLGIRLKGR